MSKFGSPNVNLSKRAFNLREAHKTDLGKKRKENQDSYAIVHSERASLYLIADGMGGSKGGSTASALAMKIIAEKAFTEDGLVNEETLSLAISASNAAIFQSSKDDKNLSGMGTTLVALALVGKTAIVAHIGDSRIYHLRDKTLKQLTKDHSFVQDLIDSGSVNEEEAEQHPIKHMLTRSLGVKESVEPEIIRLQDELQQNEKFLLCSDGLTNHVNNHEIEAILLENNPEAAVNTFVETALNKGGLDNITVEVVELCSSLDAFGVIDFPEGSEFKQEIISSIDLVDLGREETDESEEFKVEEGAFLNTFEEVSDDFADDFETEFRYDTEGDLGTKGFSKFFRYVIYLILFLTVIAVVKYLFANQHQTSDFQSKQIEIKKEVKAIEQKSGKLFSGNLVEGESSKERSGSSQFENEIQSLAGQKEELVLEAEKVVQNIEEEVAGKLDSLFEDKVEGAIESAEDDSLAVERKIIAVSSFISMLEPKAMYEREGDELDEAVLWDEDYSAATIGSESPASTKAGEFQVLGQEERAGLLKEKQELREQIADLDLRLQMANLDSSADVQAEMRRLSSELRVIGKAIKKVESEKKEAQKIKNLWEPKLEGFSDEEMVILADELVGLSDVLTNVREGFRHASYQYLSTMEHKESAVSDPQAESKLAASGRKYKAKKLELRKAVVDVVTEIVKQLELKLNKKELILSLLKKERERANRYIGFWAAYRPNEAETGKDRFRKLMQSRSELSARLEQLRVRLSDEDEFSLLQQNK